VYVTAYVDEQTMGQARTPTPLLVIRKPFDARQLQKTLAQVLAPPPAQP